MGAMLFQNVIGKSDHLVVYASRLLNKAELNNNIIEREALAMVFACTSLDIICWAICLFFMWIIWHWSILSTNHRFQGKQLDGCYYF
jgi:hypothetical protein